MLRQQDNPKMQSNDNTRTEKTQFRQKGDRLAGREKQVGMIKRDQNMRSKKSRGNQAQEKTFTVM